MQNGTNTDGTSNKAIVSNITLEGEITNGQQSDDMGTLINKLYGGEVNTVTSMVKITGTISDSGSPCVGGIIGSIRSSDTINDVKYTAGDVKIAYCVATYKISSVTNEEGLLSTGGRGDFGINKISDEHLGAESFKYLVLDAAGNSVYSKNSFIAAGEDGNIYTSAFCSQQSKTNLMVLATLTQSTGRNIIIEGFSLSNLTEPEYKFSTNIILYVNGDIDSAVDQVISSITNAINNRSYTKSNGQAINDSEHSGISSRWRGGAGNGISLMVLL